MRMVRRRPHPQGRAGERRIATSLVVDSRTRLVSSSFLALLAPQAGAVHAESSDGAEASRTTRADAAARDGAASAWSAAILPRVRRSVKAACGERGGAANVRV